MDTQLTLTDGNSTGEPDVTALNTVEPTNPMALLAMAVENGLDTDRLEALVNLTERWEAREASKAYADAMQAAQNEMPGVTKDAYNEQTKSRYSRYETVSSAIDPVVHKHGFSLSFSTADAPEGFIRVVATVRHKAGHSEQHHVDLPLDNSGIKGTVNKTGTHAAGSTITYGRRYLKLMIFDVAMSGEDNDGNDGQKLSEGQLARLNQLLDKCKADVPLFCQSFNIERVEDLPASRLEEAINKCYQKMRNDNGSL